MRQPINRYLSILLTLAMIVVYSLPGIALASPSKMEVFLNLDKASYSAGETANVTVQFKDIVHSSPEGLAAIQLSVVYDSSKFDTTPFTSLNAITNQQEYVLTTGFTKGSVVADASLYDYSKPVDTDLGGGLRKITFLVFDNTGGMTPVPLPDFDLGTFKIKVKDGVTTGATLSIEEATVQLANGDINLTPIDNSKVVFNPSTLNIVAGPTLVSGITVTGAANATTVVAGSTLAMNAAVLPADASNKAVTWSVVNGTGTATINSAGVLQGDTVGDVTVKATANDGSATFGTAVITVTAAPVLATGITVTSSSSSVTIGSTLAMGVQFTPAGVSNNNVTWSVANGTGSATISPLGVLTPVTAGNVVVKATAADGSGVFGTKTITVNDPVVSVTGVSVTSVTYTVYNGNTLQLTGTVTPSNATNKALNWSVTPGTGTATIDALTGLLIGTGNGTVTVKATAADGSGVFGTKSITVIAPPVVTVNVTGITVNAQQDTVMNGQVSYATAIVTPLNATNNAVTWSIINGSGSATLNNQNSGSFTGTSVGTFTIKATAKDGSGVFGTKVITITPIVVSSITVASSTGSYSVVSGSTLDFIGTVLPTNAANKNIEWTVTNVTGTATIDANGVLTAGKPGTVNVVAVARDGSGSYGMKVVTITAAPSTNVPVTSIDVQGQDGVVSVISGNTLLMESTSLPTNATNGTVVWSIDNGTGTATIDSQTGLLTAGKVGTVIVKATSVDGSGVVGSKEITILEVPAVKVPVTAINLTGSANATQVRVGSTLQISKAVAPNNATDNTVTWSVYNNSGNSTIDSNGLLSATGQGLVTVTAKANDGSGIEGKLEITILPVASNNRPSGGGGGGGIPTPTTPTTPETTTPTTPETKPSTSVFEGVVNINEVVLAITKKLNELKSNATNSGEFKDASSHWANKTIAIFAALGVINGYEDGSIKPDASITRAEFATIISKVFGITTVANSGTSLKDTANHWANGAISALASNGIISGYEDGSFKPDKQISRAEIIAIISKIVNLNTVKTSSNVSFSDISGAWNKDQIQAAADAGIINGKSDKQFAPNDQSTRAEALTILLNSLKVNPELRALFDGK